jgi:hypothetical protein
MNTQRFVNSVGWMETLVGLVVGSLLTAVAFAQNPVPQIVGPVKPQAVSPGGQDFTLTVYGANFVSGAVVNWNGQPRATKFVSRRELQAQILAVDIAQNTAGTISVTNPGPGGGNSSASFAQLEVHDPTATINPGPPQPVSRVLGIGYGPVVIADFNGDGSLDMFTDGLMLLGNGDGTFDLDWHTESYYGPFGSVYGDFNGDGKPDLAYIAFDAKNPYNPPREFVVMLGDGTGSFQKGSTYWDKPDIGYRYLAAGDFNGDGNLDLAVAADQKVEMFSGNGDGTFQYVWERTFPGMGNGVSIFAGDFNGDGILDLLTEDQYGDVYLLLGKGDGTFRHPGTAITSFPPSTCGLVTVNDFNGDGKLDLLMYCPGLEENQIVVLLGNGDGTFQQPVMSTVNPASPFTLAAGDFNSDGATDIIVSNAGTINQYQFFHIPWQRRWNVPTTTGGYPTPRLLWRRGNGSRRF